MALPSSGTIKMSQINTELGRSATATISLDNAESGVYGTINTNSSSRPNNNRPAAMSEWYSYDHDAAPPVTPYPGRISSTAADISTEACFNDVTVEIYKDGVSPDPQQGDILYSNDTLSIPYNVRDFNKWYKYEDLVTSQIYSVYIIDGGGVSIIDDAQLCTI